MANQAAAPEMVGPPASGAAVDIDRARDAMRQLSESLIGSSYPAADRSVGEQSPDAKSSQHPCRPWSLGDLTTRVNTYSLGRWFAPPAGLSPLECSRYGWSVVGVQVSRLQWRKATTDCWIARRH